MRKSPLAVAACLVLSTLAAAGLSGCVGSTPEPSVVPGASCSGAPVYVGYYCRDDGYPGECPESERCVPPDQCGAAPGPNDEARPAHKRRM